LGFEHVACIGECTVDKTVADVDIADDVVDETAADVEV
jgi:hypothetical protein